MTQTPDQIINQAVQRGLIPDAGTDAAAAIRLLAASSPVEAAQLVAAARGPLDVAGIVLRSRGGSLDGAIASLVALGLTRERAEAALVRELGVTTSALAADQRAAVEGHIRAEGGPAASLEGVVAQLVASGMTRDQAERAAHRTVVASLEHAVSRGAGR